jgi:hypothetical protein
MHDHEDRGRKGDLLALLPHLSGSAEDVEYPPEDAPLQKRITSTPHSRCSVLENVAPDATREERIELLMKIIKMREERKGSSIAVFQKPDKTYFALYVASEDAAPKHAKKRAKKAEQNGDKTVKKTKKRPSQQQIMREDAEKLSDLIATSEAGRVAPKDAEPVVVAPSPPAAHGLGRGKGLMFACLDVLGMSRRGFGDTIPLVENPTPSGVIALPDACACPCGCTNTETPAKSARLDLTSKKRACNTCTMNQQKKMKACWDKQDEEVKRRRMEEGGAGAAEEMAEE